MLGRLPRGERAVLVLRYFEDLSEAETARALEVGRHGGEPVRQGVARLRIDAALADWTGGCLYSEGEPGS